MRHAEIFREPSTVHGTIGVFVLHGRPGAPLWTIEPPWKDNAIGLSCIPPDEYLVEPHVSPRYGECYIVTGTAPRTFILRHGGNVGGDKELGFHTHTLGCILPGMRRGWLTVKGKRQQAVLASKTACRHHDTWARRQPHLLTIHAP